VNIRERLKGIYGPTARLVLEENQPRGVVAILEIPEATGLAGEMVDNPVQEKPHNVARAA
jgi:hypothetical protein